MGALFGKSKTGKSRITEQDRAVLQLKQQRDKLKQYQRRIEGDLERDRGLAVDLLKNGKRERAKLLLRKKKYQERLLADTDNQLENMERLVHDIEFAQVQIQVLDGLKAGNAALDEVHKILDIDEIEQIMEDTKEAVDKQNEIDSLLGGALTQEDEKAAEAELEAMLSRELPDVPTGELVTPEPPPRQKEKDRPRPVALRA